MKATEKDLLALEKKFWTGDEKFYRENVDASCLIAFAEMSGLMGNKDIAATAKDGNRWKKLDIEEKGFLQPSDDIAMLTYEAKAMRGTGEPYAAIVSTGYVKRDNGWKMMFHAHTPIEDDKKKAEPRKKKAA
jgi:hypothetical protein